MWWKLGLKRPASCDITNYKLARSRWEPVPQCTLARFPNLATFSHRFCSTPSPATRQPLSHEHFLVIKHVFLGPRQQLHCLHITLAYFLLTASVRGGEGIGFTSRLKLRGRKCVLMVTHTQVEIFNLFIWYEVSLDKHMITHWQHLKEVKITFHWVFKKGTSFKEENNKTVWGNKKALNPTRIQTMKELWKEIYNRSITYFGLTITRLLEMFLTYSGDKETCHFSC